MGQKEILMHSYYRGWEDKCVPNNTINFPIMNVQVLILPLK